LPRSLTWGLAIAIGLAAGLDSTMETGARFARLVTAAGMLCGAGFGVIYLLALPIYLKRPWQRIGFRVIGSWIAASALLVLAFAAAEGIGTIAGRSTGSMVP
jgi:hypothetical protein